MSFCSRLPLPGARAPLALSHTSNTPSPLAIGSARLPGNGEAAGLFGQGPPPEIDCPDKRPTHALLHYSATALLPLLDAAGENRNAPPRAVPYFPCIRWYIGSGAAPRGGRKALRTQTPADRQTVLDEVSA